MKTTASGSRNKIVWAIDPFQDPKYSKTIIAALRYWSKKLNCDVQPIAVISSALAGFPPNFFTTLTVPFEQAAKNAVISYFKKTDSKGFLAPQLIFSSTSSSRRMAVELASSVYKMKAAMIFANTHAKKGWNPFRLGGFAETLATSSKIPVFLLNDNVKFKSELENVFFPTNYGRESRQALVSLIPFLQAFDAKVQLYNQVERTDVYTPYYYEFAPAIDMVSLAKATEAARIKRGRNWVSYLNKFGLKCETIVQRQKKSTSTDILKTAKEKKADLIALASERGPMSQAFLGGTVRDVILQAHCSVLIFNKTRDKKNLLLDSNKTVKRKTLKENKDYLFARSQIT